MFGIENSLISTVGLIAGTSIGTSNKHFVIVSAVVAIVIEAVAMGVGEYLSDDAVQDLDKLKRHRDNPEFSGMLMTAAGTAAGLIPLAPMIFLNNPAALATSIALALAILFLLGYVKARVLRTSTWRGGGKIMLVGGSAVLIGALVGWLFKI